MIGLIETQMGTLVAFAVLRNIHDYKQVDVEGMF